MNRDSLIIQMTTESYVLAIQIATDNSWFTTDADVNLIASIDEGHLPEDSRPKAEHLAFAVIAENYKMASVLASRLPNPTQAVSILRALGLHEEANAVSAIAIESEKEEESSDDMVCLSDIMYPNDRVTEEIIDEMTHTNEEEPFSR